MKKQALKTISLVIGILIGVVGLAYGIAALMMRPVQQLPWYTDYSYQNEPLILAHQAGEGEYPSNSRIGFEAAQQAGSDVLDGDVLVTKDGHFILFHDEELQHRTNGDGYVKDRTLAELQQLDFAYLWTPDGGKTFPYRAKGVRVLTVDELLQVFPSIRLGLEMKEISQKDAERFCELITRFRALDRVLVSSALHENMVAFRRSCPQVATSATQKEATLFYVFHRLRLTGLLRPRFSSLQLPETSGSRTILTKAFIKDAHTHGLPVYAWTIDTPEQAQHFIDLGVDGINTSYPKRILEYFEHTEQ